MIVFFAVLENTDEWGEIESFAKRKEKWLRKYLEFQFVIEGYMTVSEVAEKWSINKCTVQILCADNKIDGVSRFEKSWAIPSDTERPDDKRVKAGHYKDWRKKNRNEARMTVYIIAD